MEKTRSLQQSKYYWKVVIGALQEKAKEEGNPVSKERAHWLAMIAIGHCEFKERWGVTSLEPKPTHDLPMKEYDEKLEQVRHWAALKLDKQIPLPNEGITYPHWNDTVHYKREGKPNVQAN